MAKVIILCSNNPQQRFAACLKIAGAEVSSEAINHAKHCCGRIGGGRGAGCLASRHATSPRTSVSNHTGGAKETTTLGAITDFEIGPSRRSSPGAVYYFFNPAMIVAENVLRMWWS